MLELEDVSRVYRNGSGASEMTMQVRPGEVVAVIGLNGAGKTTLMRLALGMLRAHHGTVKLFGFPLESVSSAQWARVGALVDVPLAYPELTVRTNLRIACLLRGTAPERVQDSLDAWALAPVADRRFRHLSMGNRQRVGLAAALQHDPDLIVLDEPSSALDPASVILVRQQLIRRARGGAAILISSHHLDEVSRIADRVLMMNGGRLIGELDTTGHDLEREFFERIRRDDELRGTEVLG